MKSSMVIGLAILSLAANLYAAEDHEKALVAEVQKSGFTKTKNQFLNGVYLKPGVNFSEYQHLQIAELDTGNVTVHSPSKEPWVLTDEDKAYFKEEFKETFDEELIESDKFKAADGKAKALLIKSTLLELAPTAKKDDEFSRTRPLASKIYTDGAGAITMKIEIYDAQTKALLGVLAEKTDLSKRWGPNNETYNKHQLTTGFARWANSLGEALGAK